MDLHISIPNGFGSSKFYDKRDDFNFATVNFHFFFDGDVTRSTSYGDYISTEPRKGHFLSDIYQKRN